MIAWNKSKKVFHCIASFEVVQEIILQSFFNGNADHKIP